MADSVLDTSGLTCPLPVLKAKKAIAKLSPGAVLQVIATDPASTLDFEVFCSAGGHTLVRQSESGGVYRFEIRRGVPRPA